MGRKPTQLSDDPLGGIQVQQHGSLHDGGLKPPKMKALQDDVISSTTYTMSSWERNMVKKREGHVECMLESSALPISLPAVQFRIPLGAGT